MAIDKSNFLKKHSKVLKIGTGFIVLISILGLLAIFLNAKQYKKALENYKTSFKEQAELPSNQLALGSTDILQESADKLKVDSLSGFKLKSKDYTKPDIVLPSS